MSILKTIMAQLGISAAPANNFTLDASADDGTMKLARGNAGEPISNVLYVDSQNNITTTGSLVVDPSRVINAATIRFDKVTSRGTNIDAIALAADGKLAFPQGGPLGEYQQVGDVARVGGYYPGQETISINTRQLWPAGFISSVYVESPPGIIDTATAKITPRRRGYYLVGCYATAGLDGVSFTETIVYKNGVQETGGLNTSGINDVGYLQAQIVMPIYMNGTTDYLQPGVRFGSSSGKTQVNLNDASFSIYAIFLRP